MKIVIDIDEEVYECCLPYKDDIVISNNCNYLPEMTYSIANGKPLPNNHGRLIDADELKKIWNGCKFIGSIDCLLDCRPTIIEAESEDNE